MIMMIRWTGLYLTYYWILVVFVIVDQIAVGMETVVVAENVVVDESACEIYCEELWCDYE